MALGALSSFFILSPRGDTIIIKVCTHACTDRLCLSMCTWGSGRQSQSTHANQTNPPSHTHLPQKTKDFRGDALPNAAEILFRKVKFWEKGDAPPVFHVDGVNFLFVRKNGLLFGATTRFNVSPSTTVELLNRMAKVFKDYCGVLSEVRFPPSVHWAVCVCVGVCIGQCTCVAPPPRAPTSIQSIDSCPMPHPARTRT